MNKFIDYSKYYITRGLFAYLLVPVLFLLILYTYVKDGLILTYIEVAQDFKDMRKYNRRIKQSLDEKWK